MYKETSSVETEHLYVSGKIFNKEFCSLQEHVKQLKQEVQNMENEIIRIQMMLHRFTYFEETDSMQLDAKSFEVKDVT